MAEDKRNLATLPLPAHHARQERQVRRWLLAGFALMIILLVADVVIGFSTIISIRQSVSQLTESQFQSVERIDELQKAQAALGTLLYRVALSESPSGAEPLPNSLKEVEEVLQKLFRSIPADDPDIAIWRDAENAALELARQAGQAQLRTRTDKADLTAILKVREKFLSHTAQLIRSNHDRAEATRAQIDAIATYQLWEDGALLSGCILIACLGAWLIFRTTSRLYQEIRNQNVELAHVTWQLLEKQENLARRLSHELHDELGQSLTALKTNFSRHVQRAGADQAWLEDCQQLLTDSIRSAHEISVLLRPTLLDDFGLDAALAWLCERFEDRNRIRVHYRSACPKRLEPETETQLFRIAQEALTNVARHAQATRVDVDLRVEAGLVRLQIADNGVGFTAERNDSRPRFGLTGMRARARALNGEMKLSSRPGEGVRIEIVFPERENKAE